MTKDYIQQRLDWLRFKDRRHERVFVFFDTLLGEGYDPFLLETWLDGIYDGVVVVSGRCITRSAGCDRGSSAASIHS